MRRSNVVLPEPFGPTRPALEPGPRTNETSLRTVSGPYDFVSPLYAQHDSFPSARSAGEPERASRRAVKAACGERGSLAERAGEQGNGTVPMRTILGRTHVRPILWPTTAPASSPSLRASSLIALFYQSVRQ